MKKLSSKFTETILDSMYYLISIDKFGNITRMSKDYIELIGKPKEEIYGKNVLSIIPNSKLIEVLESGVDDIGSLYTMIDGKEVICNRLCTRIDGEIEGVVSTATFLNFADLNSLNERVEKLEQENVYFKQSLKDAHKRLVHEYPIIGHSPAMKKAINIVDEVADSDLTVLLTGETGTGKEIFADRVQGMSSREYEKYVKINCAAIPENLLESELFGYTKGAFTGALNSGKVGKFELAHRGTLLLDEIGEMPLELQSKLLRVLQEREIDKLGSSEPIPIDVRIIASTNKDINKLVNEGKFRRDLYFRLNTVEIEIPPLRDRLSDIRELSDFFIKKINKRTGLYITGVEERIFELFQHYNWPGNVRELEHVLERPMVLKKKGILTFNDFEFFIERLSEDFENETLKYDTLDSSIKKIEREKIKEILISTKNNKSETAKILGISRGTLYKRLKELEIDIFD